VQINRTDKVDVPKNSISLVFDEIAFVLDDEQYRAATLCMDSMHRAQLQKKASEFGGLTWD
jgi:hypothetical protein